MKYIIKTNYNDGRFEVVNSNNNEVVCSAQTLRGAETVRDTSNKQEE